MPVDINNLSSALQVIQDAAQILVQEQSQCGAFPPGHFYSCIPSQETLHNYLQMVNDSSVPNILPDIDLNAENQLALLTEFVQFGHQLSFPETPMPPYRYYYQNDFYSYTDAIFLHCMIRYLRPRRIVEIGSGFSSCVALDTNELFFNNQIQCNFIEPYPERLLQNLKPEDWNCATLLKQNLQTIELNYFESLEAGDILFIDSTHVSKLNSDVNYLFFNVLPCLKPGVFIHFHDIFYPFEYPEYFLRNGFYWNECYILRAFLINNPHYKIRLFSDYLQRFYREALEAVSPLCLKNTGGNIWLEKL